MRIHTYTRTCPLKKTSSIHTILRSWLCLCQLFSGSKRYEKVGHSNRISQCDLSTPRLAILTGCLHLYSLLALVALGGTQEPFGTRGVGLQQRPGPQLTCFNNFLPSSVKLCKYFSPVSSSLECQLRMSVQFSWQLLSRLADSRDLCWSWG